MSELQATFQPTENYLLITGHGERDDLASIVDASKRIDELVKQFQNNYLLVDYREVKFNFPLTNIFDLIRVLETRMPNYKNVKIAAVLSEMNLSFGKYWKDIAQKRGFDFMFFEDFVSAEKWLIAKRKGVTS